MTKERSAALRLNLQGSISSGSGYRRPEEPKPNLCVRVSHMLLTWVLVERGRTEGLVEEQLKIGPLKRPGEATSKGAALVTVETPGLC